MSEPIPESIPTSADPRSHRPAKKARGLATTSSKQASELEALFAHPEREVRLPTVLKAKTLAAPPEIVTNVQGSSAGAGSGEFHVYKASRRREYERLRLMDEETKKEEADKEFEAKREDMKKKDEEKTSKNRARRQKQKERQGKKLDANNGASISRDESGPVYGDGPLHGAMKPVEVKRSAADEEHAAGGEVQNPEEIGITIHDDD